MMTPLVLLYLLFKFLFNTFFQCSSQPQKKVVSSAGGVEDDENMDERSSSSCNSIILPKHFHSSVGVSLRQRGRTLVLTNFIAHGSPRDMLRLCKKECPSSLTTIVFEDTVQGAGYRRWLFKKTGVYRRFLDMAEQELGIDDVQFHTTVEIPCCDHRKCPVAATSSGSRSRGCTSPKTIVSLLEALKADEDVKSIVFTGNLGFRDAIYTVQDGLKNLLQADHRQWQKVCLQDLEFNASSQTEAMLARKYCQRTLQQVATQRYINIQI